MLNYFLKSGFYCVHFFFNSVLLVLSALHWTWSSIIEKISYILCDLSLFFGFLLFYGENVLLICIRKYRKRFLIQPKMLIWSETNSVVLLSKRFWKTDDLLISHKYFQIPDFVLRFLWKASFGLDSFESVSRYINISVELYHRAITTIVSMEGAAFNFGFVSGCKQRILFIYTSLCLFVEFSLETLTREWESLTSLLCRKVTNILCSWAR